MNIVKASPADSGFITLAVFEAVKSGSTILSYATLFEKSEEELQPLFKEMIEEDIEGQELSLSGFLVAKNENDMPAATCCAWIEGEEGPSGMLTAQVLSFGLGQDTYQKALTKHEIIEGLRVDREEGALQFEHVYTAPNYRGQGLAAQLISAQIKRYKALHPKLKKAQIILFKTNAAALHTYSKIGFTIAHEQVSNHPDILNYFPANTRVLMEVPI